MPHWLIELRGIEQASAEQAPGHTPTVVELTVANSTRVIELVSDVNVRLGFIETPHLQADLVTAHLRDDEMLVVTAPGHSLGAPPAAAVTGRDRRDADGHAGGRQRHQGHPDRSPSRPASAAQRTDRDGTRYERGGRLAIAEGVGPGVLSRLAVRDDLVLGRLVAIEVAGPPLIRQLTAVWRPDLDPLPPEAARLLAVAKGAALAHG